MIRPFQFKNFSAAVLLLLLFAYWPACASSSNIGATGPSSGDDATSLLPSFSQPAFAAASSPSGLSIADVAEMVTPSVVSVHVSAEKAAPREGMPFGLPFPFGPGHQGNGKRKREGLGSGVILSADGVVVTNNHVIEDATQINVTVADGTEYPADVVGADARTDLAVLRLKGNPKGLKPIRVGQSSNLRLGDVVLAVGNPFGVGQTVTMGIVSAKGRADVGIVDYEDFIQTDAAINPGNSGGALVNMRGELVGVNTAILSRSGGNQGIGFAIPTDMASGIVDSLLKNGKVVRGFLGVNIQDVDSALAKALGLADTNGVLVSGVSPGSAADKAGVQRGDVITAVDGVVADSTGRLRNLIAAKGAARPVKLSILRSGKAMTVEVTLGTLKEAEHPAGEAGETPGSSQSLGMSLVPLTDEVARRFDLESTSGRVLVARVATGSKAAEAGIRPGDVLLEVNKKAIDSVERAESLLSRSKGNALVVVQRGAMTRYLVIER